MKWFSSLSKKYFCRLCMLILAAAFLISTGGCLQQSAESSIASESPSEPITSIPPLPLPLSTSPIPTLVSKESSLATPPLQTDPEPVQASGDSSLNPDVEKNRTEGAHPLLCYRENSAPGLELVQTVYNKWPEPGEDGCFLSSVWDHAQLSDITASEYP